MKTDYVDGFFFQIGRVYTHDWFDEKFAMTACDNNTCELKIIRKHPNPKWMGDMIWRGTKYECEQTFTPTVDEVKLF